jgi:adenylate cyclase
VAKDQGFPFFELVGVGFRSLAVLQSGQGGVKEIGELKNAIAAFQALGAGEPALRMRTFLAQGLAYLPDVDAGLRECEEGLRLALQHDQREFEPILLRVHGDLLSMQGRDLNRAADSYRKSIAVAKGQHARSFELHDALGLARLHSRRGEYEDARAVLAPVYNWFTEGFDTKDLQ